MWGAVTTTDVAARGRRQVPRLSLLLPVTLGLLLPETTRAQDLTRDCWSAVRMLAGLVADPPHDDLAVAHYTAAHRHLARARTACTQGQNDRAMREAERGIRRLQNRENS